MRLNWVVLPFPRDKKRKKTFVGPLFKVITKVGSRVRHIFKTNCRISELWANFETRKVTKPKVTDEFSDMGRRHTTPGTHFRWKFRGILDGGQINFGLIWEEVVKIGCILNRNFLASWIMNEAEVSRSTLSQGQQKKKKLSGSPI